MADNPFEIPQALRDLAEQNIKQAHAAYEQLRDLATKAIDAWMEAMPASPMATGFKDVQDRAAEIAKKNVDSAFALVEKIAKAQNFQEILTLQMQFAQDRMQAFATQTQQLFGLMGEAFQKSERGAFGAGVGPTASNLLVAAFEDVTDSAGAMAKTNAESASALVEKNANPAGIPQAMREQAEQNMKETHAAQSSSRIS
jgi:hypothetical protein